MFLDIDPRRKPPVTLAQSTDFDSLSVLVHATPETVRLHDVLLGWGEFDGTHVWLSTQRLEDELGDHFGTDLTWRERFTAMLDYALAQGWFDESGLSVRAHCRWQTL
ncbi:hypothetical protein [Nocardia sp. NPDC055165]